jgi:glycosyltransferase involved in cell wall biosynthesis
VRLLGLLRRLAESHAVSLLSFVPASQDNAPALDAVREYCEEVAVVPNDRIGLSGAARRALQLGALLSSRSYDGFVFERAFFQAALDRMTARSRYDVIQAETCFMTGYKFPSDTLVVLDEHNIEYEVRRRSVSVAGSLPRKIQNYLDFLALRREEQGSWRSIDACAVTSERDAAVISRTLPLVRAAVVPNAVDTEHFMPQPDRTVPGTVLFFGTLGYHPNVDGILFFLREVLPLLRRATPGLTVQVVGAAPPPAVLRLAGPDVIVTGEVDDVRPYLARAQAVIAPLRIGGGTRLKILEAMAMGKPVVSTTLGAEGLAARADKEILIADTPETFARQLGRILVDDRLATALGSAARRLVETSYDWSASAEKLVALYRSALDRAHPRRTMAKALTAS